MATRRPGGLPPAAAPPLRGGFLVDYGPRIDDRRQGLSSSGSRPGHNSRDDQEDTPPSRHLWIGNVSQDASEAILRDKFAQFGEVDSVTVYSSRNYAFVNFRNLDDAVEAKNRLQGFVLGGMAIRIEYAKGRMMKNEPARERGADSDYAKIVEEQVAARATQSRHLWVGGISPNVSKDQIEGEFRKYGVMEDFKLLRERNCAFVDYVKIEDAVNAVEALNRTRIGDEELRVDYGRSQPAKRDFRGEQRGSQDSYGPQHGMQGGAGFGEGRVKADKDGGPSEILWVGFPLPSKVDEDGLRRAFMPYGEVERVKTFPGRTYAFVQFQKVEEATRAKNALDGKLFDDPRVHIRYSKSEIGPIDSPRDGPTASSQRLGDRQGFSSDVVGGPRGISSGSDRFGSPGRASGNPNSRLGGGLRPEYRPNALIAGLVERGSSREPDGGPPGMGRRSSNHLDDVEYSRGIRPDSRSSYDDAWDLPDADIVPRDSKRLRVYPGGGADSSGFDPWYEQRQQQGSDSGAYGTGGPNNYEPLRVPASTDYSLGLGGRPRAGLPDNNNPLTLGTRPAGSGHAPAPNSSVMSITSPYSKNAVEDVKGPEGWQWHGTIAKGGTPVCRARCLPVGKGIDATVPDVVNCTARTDLDMLAKHVYQAGGFGVVFFVPEGDPDVPPYQDFMHYLGEKHRAGVAKLADGTTLFLVPPSEFSEKVLKVPGDNCLFGVVLKFQQPAPAPVISYNPSAQQQQQVPPLSQHPTYSQQQIPSQHASGPQSQYLQNQTLGQHVPANQEPALYQGFHPSLPHDSQPSQTGIPTSIGLNDSLSVSNSNSNPNNSPMLTQTQLASIAGLPGVLTPELIASLTALLPKTNASLPASSTESNLAPPIVSKGMKTFTGISGMPIGSTQSLGGTPSQSDARPSFRPSQNTPPSGPAQGWLQQQNQQERSQVGPPSYHSQAADQSSMFTSQPPTQQLHLPNPPQQLQQQLHQPQQSQQSSVQVQPTHIAGPAAPGGQGPGFAGPPLHQQGYTGPSGSGVQQFPPLPQMPRPPQQPMGAPQQHLGAPPQLPGDQLAQLTALLTQRQQQPSQQQAASQLLQQHFQQSSNSHPTGQATGASQPQQGSGSQSQAPLQPPQGLAQGPPQAPSQGPPQGHPQGHPQGPPQGPSQGPQGPSQGPPQGPTQGPPQGPQGPQQPQPPNYGQYSQPPWGQVSAPQSSGISQSPLVMPQLQQQNASHVQAGNWETALSQANAGVEQQAGFQNQGAGDADAQTKRFQATVQLAAALLQQMQQQQGKPSGGQEQR